MKVIFVENIRGIASKGDVRNVKEGYYRNYLMPRSLAVFATDTLLAQWESKRKELMIGKQQLLKKLEETQARLSGARVKIEKKMTKKGTLYGGVHAVDIVEAVMKQLHVELPEDGIIITDAIKTMGNHDIKVNLGEGVEGMIPLEIVEKQ